MSGNQQVLDILKKAYQIEIDGYTFYSMTAERAEKEAVQELFAKLAADEVQHQAFLRGIAGVYNAKGADAFKIDLRSPEARARLPCPIPRCRTNMRPGALPTPTRCREPRLASRSPRKPPGS